MTRMAGSKNVTDFLGIKPEYGDIGLQDIANEGIESALVTRGNGLTTNAVLDGASGMAGTRYWGDATISSGAQAGLTDAVGGIASGIGGLASFMPKGGLFNKSKGLSPEMQQASISGGLNLGSSLAGMIKKS